jgi:hypothetical protein
MSSKSTRKSFEEDCDFDDSDIFHDDYDQYDQYDEHDQYGHHDNRDEYSSESEESYVNSAKKSARALKDEAKYFEEERREIIHDISTYPICEYDFVSASQKDTKSSLVAITNGHNYFREKEFGQVTIPYYLLPTEFWERKCYVVPKGPVTFCPHCGIVLPSRHKNDMCRTCVDYVEDAEYEEDTDDECSCDEEEDYMCYVHRR